MLVSELAIALIGTSRTEAARNTLVNILGLKLDGAAAEEFSCQMLISGKNILPKLKTLDTHLVRLNCESAFIVEKKPWITDVNLEQVCNTESEIRAKKEEYIAAIKTRQKCDG